MIALALQKLYPNITWRLEDEPKTADEYKKFLEWHSDINPPTWEEIQTAHEQVLVEMELNRIQKQRSNAYRSESDPLFFKYQRGEVTKEEWEAKVEEIRTRYPYPS